MEEKKFGKLGIDLKEGFHKATEQSSKMLMDIGVYVIKKDDELIIHRKKDEVALVILTGEINLKWDQSEDTIKRNNVFEENPECLHVPKDTKVYIKATKDSEILFQATENENHFTPHLYHASDITANIFGKGVWQGTATRTVRTIFDYESAPYSNMVNGEVITSPGRWSSYIPHHHPQPEVYLYKFDRKQGFGASFVGEDVYRTEHNSYVAITGGNDHPQVTAPGYAMWYSWMIRHLPNDPWAKTRIICEEHGWLEEKDVDTKIWQPK